MRKWISYFCPLIMILILTSFRFGPASELEVPATLKVSKPTPVLFPQNKTYEVKTVVNPPFLGNSYVGFKEALAFKESQGDYFVINTLGYLGKYQFGVGTLQLMGVYNASNFLNDPELQEKVFQVNVARNKWILRKDIQRYAGRRIGGIHITESGILAAAHLAGAGNVKKYLRSYGQIDFEDAYGTTVRHYMKKFSGYDVSDVLPERNARI
ncbi:hypothetical protein GGR42_001009 [Saonia flava]|uniref:Peptidoglycan-binding protein LysM n=2 Tax=Saonia flava TaxID=523696 RepID=A0A846QTJ6_9FLAO|nr:hypothetical protein [Saonia flava]NJB70547.1 hypothetical protein [Saonia flava]